MHEDKVKRIGIYHSKDMDGICCGAIMKLKYPDITLIGFDYGENIWLKLMAAGFASEEKNEAEPATCFPPNGFDGEVIMADVSLKRDEMFKLAEWCGNRFTWIDHHKSAIEDVCGGIPSLNPRRFNMQSPQNREVFIRMCVEVGPAACELCWDYLIKNSRVHQDTPDVVQLLGEYDTWRNQDKERWDNAIMPFQYGMRLVCTGVDDFPMDLFNWAEPFMPLVGPCPVTEKGMQIMRDGRTVLKYQKQQNKRAADMTAFEVEFEGLRAICLNSGGANSQLFESVWDPEKHDIMMPFVFTGKYWVFSIYTTKPEIDCSELAKRYGGGGHKGAAGFQVNRWEVLHRRAEKSGNEKTFLLIDRDEAVI